MSARTLDECRRRSGVGREGFGLVQDVADVVIGAVAGHHGVRNEEVGELVESKLAASVDGVDEDGVAGGKIAVQGERDGEVLLRPGELDERARIARQLDRDVQLLRRLAGKQLHLAELHDGAELGLRASGRLGLVGLLRPGRLSPGAVAEEVEGAAL